MFLKDRFFHHFLVQGAKEEGYSCLISTKNHKVSNDLHMCLGKKYISLEEGGGRGFRAQVPTHSDCLNETIPDNNLPLPVDFN